MRACVCVACIFVVGCGSSEAVSIGSNGPDGGPTPDGGNVLPPGPDPGSDAGSETDGGGDGGGVAERCDPGVAAATLCGLTLQPPIKLHNFVQGVTSVAAGGDGSFITTFDFSQGLVSRYTDAGGWSKPDQPAGGESRELRVAAGENGDAIATWIAGANEPTVWARRFTSGTWAAPVELGKSRANGGLNLQLDGAPNGRAVASWFRPAARTTALAIFDPAAGWSQSDVAADSPGFVAIDSAGNAAAVFVRQPSGSFDHRAYVTRRAAGASWQPELLVSSSSSPSSVVGPQIASYSGGRFVIVWHDLETKTIFASRFDPGSGWSSPQTLDTNTLSQPSPGLAIDDSGFGFVTWNRAGAGMPVPMIARFDPASGFGVPSPAPGAGRLAVGNGKAILTWYKDGTFSSACYTADAGWSAPVDVAAGTTPSGTVPSVAVALAPTGTAAIVWAANQGICATNLR